MPHVMIKHFPVPLPEERLTALVDRVTEAVHEAFGCDDAVISIALQPVAPEDWHESVYLPEIVGRRELLCKIPAY